MDVLYTVVCRRGCVFSSSSLSTISPASLLPFLRQRFSDLFSLLLPDDCRICGHPLTEVSRIPVCAGCLSKPQPLAAEYFCRDCGMPFLNSFPLDEEGRCGLCRAGLTGFDAAFSFGSFEGELRHLIHLFKYNRIRTLAGPLGNLLALGLPRTERFDLVAPMPMHWLDRKSVV